MISVVQIKFFVVSMSQKHSILFSSFHLSIPANANKISKIHILILQLQTSQEIKKLYVPPVWSTLKFFVSFVRIWKFLLHISSSVGIKHPYIKECYLTCLQKSTSTYVQPHSTKRWRFPLRISSVNVTKSAVWVDS